MSLTAEYDRLRGRVEAQKKLVADLFFGERKGDAMPSEMKISRACALEIHELFRQIDKILADKNISQENRKRADFMLAKTKNLRMNGISTEEMEAELHSARAERMDKLGGASGVSQRTLNRAFQMYLSGKDAECRTMLAGAQSITYTQGPSGGYLVPQDFGTKVFERLAQYDPLLDPDVVDLELSDNFSLRPSTLPAYDLSTFKAQIITEGSQQSEQANPLTAKQQSVGTTFRCRQDVSFEFEDDSAAYGKALNMFARAYGIGFARGIGAAIVAGGGSIPGLLSQAISSGVSLNLSMVNDVSVTLNDLFQPAFFALNRAYRVSPKCAWLMDDSVYQWVRSLSDKNAAPLLRIIDDEQTLMGKPVLICPSLPGLYNSPATTGTILFGDFSYLRVRLSAMLLRRKLEFPGGVEYGKAAYVGLMRADSRLVVPNSAAPPVVSIAVTN